MPAARVRVRPPHRHRGLLMLSAVVGVLGGLALHPLLVYGVIPLASRLLPVAYANGVIFVTALVCTLGLPAAGALYMARCCQHRKPVFFSGVLLGMGVAAGSLIAQRVMLPALYLNFGFAWQQLLGLLAAGLGAGVLNLLVREVYVHTVSVLREHDGTLCVACGYDVSHGGSAVCPECGTPRDTPLRPVGRIYRAADLLDRRARTFLLGALAVVVLSGGLFVAQRWPFWSFRRRFAEGAVEIMPHVDATGGKWACYVMYPLVDDPRQRILCMTYYKTTAFGAARVNLRLGNAVASPWPTPTANRFLFLDGDPVVHCRLDPDQARRLLRDGLPAALLEAMLQAADDAGWKPGAIGAAPPGRAIMVPPGTLLSAD